MKEKTTSKATVTHVCQEARRILRQCAKKAGKSSRFVKRKSKLNGAGFVQTLVFGWMSNPQAGPTQLSQTAASLGIELSAQAIDQRFGPEGAECIRQTLNAAVQSRMQQVQKGAETILNRFNGVYLRDSTITNLPNELAGVWQGCGGSERMTKAARKLQLQYDLKRGEITDFVLQAGRTQDRNAESQHTILPAGALRLADLGYFSLRVFEEQPDVYFLTRPQANIMVYDAAGGAFHLDEFLLHCDRDEIDEAVFAGSSQHLACRLLARRAPLDVAQQRRRRLKERARKKGHTISPTTLALADWTLFMTNVPSKLLSLAEAFIVARCRWQIELIFKLWKSHGRIDEWNTTNPWRILCEVYAKLLIMLIQHWLFLLCQLASLDRSFIKAVQTLQQFALAFASTLSSPSRFLQTLLLIKRSLSHGCRLNRSRKHPRTFQLLEGLA